MAGFKSAGLVLALIAALVLSACSNGGEEEIAEIKDGKPTAPPTPPLTITGLGDYVGTLTVNYVETPTSTTIKSISGTMTAVGTLQLSSQPPVGSLVVSIVTGTNPPIYVGRLIEAAISLKLNLDASGNLELRPASEGKIPIGSYAEFQLITGALSGSYKQEAELDLMGDAGLDVPAWQPIGANSAAFTGNFDGDGKQIKRLYIDKSGINYVGLFGYAGGTSTFTGVNIASGSVTGGNTVGGLVGLTLGTINNSSNNAAINGANVVGGVVGECKDINKCFNSGEVNSNGICTGGVAGRAIGNIFACYNSGDVTSSDDFTGGVTGYATENVTASYNSGDVKGKANTGGVVGMSDNMSMSSRYVTSCYNIGKVDGAGDTGGIMGQGVIGEIVACYNTGIVTSTHASWFGSITGIFSANACYWQTGSNTQALAEGGSDGCTQFNENDFFTPTGSAEWGTGDGSGSGKYWKAGTTNGTMLPKLWYEE